MTIVWSNKARTTYNKIIDDLLENWNPDIAEDFENKTNSLLDTLIKYKKLCPLSKKKRLRKCVIHKNNSLIYKIKKDKIELVAFVYNKSEHNY